MASTERVVIKLELDAACPPHQVKSIVYEVLIPVVVDFNMEKVPIPSIRFLLAGVLVTFAFVACVATSIGVTWPRR